MSAGRSAVLVCLLFVARDWGTDGVLRFPLQRVSSTKCIIVQNGFLLQKFLLLHVSYMEKDSVPSPMFFLLSVHCFVLV